MKYLSIFTKTLLLITLFITLYACNPNVGDVTQQQLQNMGLQPQSTTHNGMMEYKPIKFDKKKVKKKKVSSAYQSSLNEPRYLTYDDYVGVRDDFSGYVNEGMEAPQAGCQNYIDDGSVTDALMSGYGNTFDWIAEYMKGGSYKFPKPKTGRDHDSICKSINTIVDQNNLEKHSDALVPQASDCTYASYIGTLIMLKENNPQLFERNRENFHCRGKNPPCSRPRCTRYSGNLGLFAREPLTWMKKTLGRGNYKTIPRRAIMKNYHKGMPKKGDLVNIFRNPSGHSVIFDKIENGKFCYWSSNRSTRGMGTRCEPLSHFQNITVGSL